MHEATAPDCPVLWLARQFEELALQLDDADKPGGIGSFIGLGERMDEIAEAASYLSPKTEAGATFQVMLASAEVDTIQIGADVSQLQASKLMVQRLLYRSLEMMRTEVAEFPMSKSYMMSEELDPQVDRKD